MNYRLVARIKNNRILTLIEEQGYKSVNDFCKKNHLNATSIGNIINFKESPLLKTGGYRSFVNDMATALRVHPDHLFSEEQRTLQLETNEANKAFGEIRQLTAPEDNPELMLIEDDNAILTRERVKAALYYLSPRERDITIRLFGLEGDKPKCRLHIAKELGITLGRLWEIECRIFAKLRRALKRLSGEQCNTFDAVVDSGHDFYYPATHKDAYFYDVYKERSQ